MCQEDEDNEPKFSLLIAVLAKQIRDEFSQKKKRFWQEKTLKQKKEKLEIKEKG